MEGEEEEGNVFVYSVAYSNLMDSSPEKDEKTSVGEASTSGASSGADSPGSPMPLVPDHVIEVNHNSITLIKSSPMFRTRLPHLSAHQLALTAGSRRTRYQSPYAPKGQYAQPQSYEMWSRRRKLSNLSKRRKIEKPLIWVASAILIVLLIAGIMIAVYFWITAGSNKEENGGGIVVVSNFTNITSTTEDWSTAPPLLTKLGTMSGPVSTRGQGGGGGGFISDYSSPISLAFTGGAPILKTQTTLKSTSVGSTSENTPSTKPSSTKSEYSTSTLTSSTKETTTSLPTTTTTIPSSTFKSTTKSTVTTSTTQTTAGTTLKETDNPAIQISSSSTTLKPEDKTTTNASNVFTLSSTKVSSSLKQMVTNTVPSTTDSIILTSLSTQSAEELTEREEVISFSSKTLSTTTITTTTVSLTVMSPTGHPSKNNTDKGNL